MRLLDPAAIETEITASIDRSSDGVARASLFNIVYFDHIKKPSCVAASVDYLLGKRPARIIHIQSGYDGASEVSVSARCYPDRRNQGVCFQEVHILNGSDDRGLDPGSWSALLIRDIPVFGLIADLSRPPAAQIASLAETADKLIFDSAELEQGRPWDLLCWLAGLAARAGAAEPRPSLADFAWLRTLSLRRAIARAFDSERTAGQWASLSAVDVRGGTLAEAVLVACWLAARLGWRPVTVSRAEAHFEDPRGIDVRFSHTAPGTGVKVVLIMDGGESIEIELAGGALRTRGIDGATSEAPARPLEPGPLLLQEVDALRGDPIYYDALVCAAALQQRA
jgi:hypothetical protein